MVPADVASGARLEQVVATSIASVVPNGTADHAVPIIVTTTWSPTIASVTAHLGAACVVVGRGSGPKAGEAFTRVQPSTQRGGKQTLEAFLHGEVAEAVRAAVEALVGPALGHPPVAGAAAASAAADDDEAEDDE
jgi:hypothetical protein